MPASIGWPVSLSWPCCDFLCHSPDLEKLMRSLWNDEAADAAVAHWRAAGAGEALALRTYSARLLGADPRLVLHGGGNTSVKAIATDLFGEPVPVLYIKGSGWDLATIEPAGHPAVRLEPLLRLRDLDRLSDEDMVGAQRSEPDGRRRAQPVGRDPAPRLHPRHVHRPHPRLRGAGAWPTSRTRRRWCTSCTRRRVACVPYVMPGFDLARAAADAFERDPRVEGLILLNHGVFSFGATAKESLRADDRARHRGRRPHRAPILIQPGDAEGARRRGRRRSCQIARPGERGRGGRAGCSTFATGRSPGGWRTIPRWPIWPRAASRRPIT